MVARRPLYLPTTSDLLTLTHDGHDEDADGDDPGHLAVALPKLLHQVLEEDAEALDGSVGEHLDQEEGSGHQPAPAPVRDLVVPVGPEEGAASRGSHRHDALGERGQDSGC